MPFLAPCYVFYLEGEKKKETSLGKRKGKEQLKRL
jgi:hypothetical protein